MILSLLIINNDNINEYINKYQKDATHGEIWRTGSPTENKWKSLRDNLLGISFSTKIPLTSLSKKRKYVLNKTPKSFTLNANAFEFKRKYVLN